MEEDDKAIGFLNSGSPEGRVVKVIVDYDAPAFFAMEEGSVPRDEEGFRLAQREPSETSFRKPISTSFAEQLFPFVIS